EAAYESGAGEEEAVDHGSEDEAPEADDSGEAGREEEEQGSGAPGAQGSFGVVGALHVSAPSAGGRAAPGAGTHLTDTVHRAAFRSGVSVMLMVHVRSGMACACA